MSTNPHRAIPSVTELLSLPEAENWLTRVPRAVLVDAIRAELESYRTGLSSGSSADTRPSLAEIATGIDQRVDRFSRSPLPEVINGTGILLHTGLGRAPMAEKAVAAMAEAARNYAPLEINLETGQRGSRTSSVQTLLCKLTGAESACVVNNNAAALVLTLAAVAQNRDVIVSRGELIEIGGGFRLPEIMQTSGARLVEVGTTNRTHVEDFRRAVNHNTGALLKVHPSNYDVAGFVESVATGHLVEIAKQESTQRADPLPVIYDIGSGALEDLAPHGIGAEPSARAAIEDGADLVLFSGDKLLGGPQAGIILGRQLWIERLANYPLMRALRVDKLTLAGLEAPLRLHLEEDLAWKEVPVFALAKTPLSELTSRAEEVVGALNGSLAHSLAEVAGSDAYLGGGSLPHKHLKSVAVRLHPDKISEQEFASRLRSGNPPIVPRLHQGNVLIDMRSVFPRQDKTLIQAIVNAIQIA